MSLRRRRTRSWRSESGSELVELALTFPLLLFVLLAIVDFGLLFQKYEVITNGAREGVRLAARSSTSATDVEDRVLAYVQASGLPTAAGNPSVTVTNTTLAAGGQTYPATQVDVFYFHDYTFLAPIANWFSGSFTSVTLSAQSTMRREVGSGS